MKPVLTIDAASEILYTLAVGVQNSAESLADLAALDASPSPHTAEGWKKTDDWTEWAQECAENDLPPGFSPEQLITIAQGWDDPAAPLLVGETQNRIQIAIARLSHLASHLHAHPCNPHQPLALALELTSEVPPVGISNLVATLRTLGDA